jgi:hypothetical protein
MVGGQYKTYLNIKHMDVECLSCTYGPLLSNCSPVYGFVFSLLSLLHVCRFVAIMRFEISITIVVSGHLSILIWFESDQKCGKILRTLEDRYIYIYNIYIYSFREPWKEVKMKSLEWQYVLNVVMLLPLTMFHTWQPLEQIVVFLVL